MLELENIKKSYKVGDNYQQVLKGISVKFRRNEFTSILGSSGSGKTTLLNIISGLDRYDSGDLIIDNISTKKYSDKDWDTYRNYRVGFVFQSYNLIMHQNVLSNVEIALTLSGVSKQERRKKAIEVLKKVGLKDHIYKKPNQLSGGQMQRVAIARSLVNDPEIILADEPTGALDSTTSIQILDLLKEIASDKLVIMVTHNPELAKKYSTRIIELKDGQIINDSNPYKEEKEEVYNKKTNKTSMSLFTSLSLSLNNLLTKMGRTFLTAFAGSIGIIGIALVLSLSNGVKNFAANIEKESLADYPLSIEKTSYDIFGSLQMELSESINSDKCEENKICSKDDIVKNSVISTSKGLKKVNNTKEFKNFLDNNEEINKYIDKITYLYDITLQVFTNDYQKVNPSNLNGEETSLFKEITNNQNSFTLLAGNMPKNYDEIVLIVDNNNNINDSLLYALGIKDRSGLVKDLEKISKDEKYRVDSTSYSYNDILNKELKLILNTDYYDEINGKFVDLSNDTNYMKQIIDKGLNIKIVGIVKDENNSNNYIGYTPDLTKHVINEISKTNLYKLQINNKDYDVVSGLPFDNITNTYDKTVNKLGIYEENNPSTINLYPKDYDSKQKIVDIINKYNDEKRNNHQDDLVIEYNDLMKSLVGGISQIINIISVVLIGFIAISLIVSSIMIAIITYISVLERTKEIGILRAIGASKKDIKQVFIAETVIEGTIAGVMGILIAFLITIPINLIVSTVAKIDGIASMPILGAIFLIALSILLNVLAGLKPASMAARKDPVEALRTE